MHTLRVLWRLFWGSWRLFDSIADVLHTAKLLAIQATKVGGELGRDAQLLINDINVVEKKLRKILNDQDAEKRDGR
jgi:hypothetical protein